MKVAKIEYRARCLSCGESFDAIGYKPVSRETGRVVCDRCLNRDFAITSPVASAVQAPEICGGAVQLEDTRAKG